MEGDPSEVGLAVGVALIPGPEDNIALGMVRSPALWEHAVTRMGERSISRATVRTALRKGKRYWDPRNNSFIYLLQGGIRIWQGSYGGSTSRYWRDQNSAQSQQVASRQIHTHRLEPQEKGITDMTDKPSVIEFIKELAITPGNRSARILKLEEMVDELEDTSEEEAEVFREESRACLGQMTMSFQSHRHLAHRATIGTLPSEHETTDGVPSRMSQGSRRFFTLQANTFSD